MGQLVFQATLGGAVNLVGPNTASNYNLNVPAAAGTLLYQSGSEANGTLLIGNGTGYAANTLTAGSGVSITNGSGSITISATGSGGTVTSVSWTGGIVSVANGTTTPSFTIAGTSGGIPYFSSASTWATSAALAANAIVLGGGAGAAPATTTTGTGVVTAIGNAVNATGGLVTVDGTATLTNKTLTNPTVTNYVETPYTANSSTAITLNLANGTVQIITLTGSPTITMPTAVSGKSFILIMPTGTGSFAVTWSTVKWPGGTAPTVTTTASKTDIFSFFSDGTNWYGVVVGQNY